MAGLVTTTFYPKGKTWMPGTGPGMTKNRIRDLRRAEKLSESFSLAPRKEFLGRFHSHGANRRYGRDKPGHDREKTEMAVVFAFFSAK